MTPTALGHVGALKMSVRTPATVRAKADAGIVTTVGASAATGTATSRGTGVEEEEEDGTDQGSTHHHEEEEEEAMADMTIAIIETTIIEEEEGEVRVQHARFRDFAPPPRRSAEPYRPPPPSSSFSYCRPLVVPLSLPTGPPRRRRTLLTFQLPRSAPSPPLALPCRLRQECRPSGLGCLPCAFRCAAGRGHVRFPPGMMPPGMGMAGLQALQQQPGMMPGMGGDAGWSAWNDVMLGGAAWEAVPGMGAVPVMPAMMAQAAGASSNAIVPSNGSPAAAAAAQQAEPPPQKDADGRKRARDFSFMVTEDQQESGPNLSMLGGSSEEDSDDSDDEAEGGGGGGGGNGGGGEDDGDDMSKFEAGSAIDQLLYRQKAISGMETRRPGESAEQFMKRKIAGLKMLNADAGTAAAKDAEADVDIAVMNAKTSWHWGQGDADADFKDDEEEMPLMLTSNEEGSGGHPGLGASSSSSAAALQLTYQPEQSTAIALPGAPSGGGPPPPPPGSSMVLFDEAKAKVGRKIIGSEGIRASASLVPKAQKDDLSNAKLRPVESGRGFALLEKMGWKKGQGLGRREPARLYLSKRRLRRIWEGCVSTRRRGFANGTCISPLDAHTALHRACTHSQQQQPPSSSLPRLPPLPSPPLPSPPLPSPSPGMMPSEYTADGATMADSFMDGSISSSILAAARGAAGGSGSTAGLGASRSNRSDDG